MQYWPHMLVGLVGAGLTLQVGMNARVSLAVGSPVMATIINFCVGLALLVVIALAGGARMAPGSVATVPAWAWLGGFLGAAYVAVMTIAGPRLGAAALMAIALAGQMIAALAIDHYGIVGFPQNPVTATRLLGTVLLVVSVLLIVRR